MDSIVRPARRPATRSGPEPGIAGMVLGCRPLHIGTGGLPAAAVAPMLPGTRGRGQSRPILALSHRLNDGSAIPKPLEGRNKSDRRTLGKVAQTNAFHGRGTWPAAEDGMPEVRFGYSAHGAYGLSDARTRLKHLLEAIDRGSTRSPLVCDLSRLTSKAPRTDQFIEKDFGK